MSVVTFRLPYRILEHGSASMLPLLHMLPSDRAPQGEPYGIQYGGLNLPSVGDSV